MKLVEKIYKGRIIIFCDYMRPVNDDHCIMRAMIVVDREIWVEDMEIPRHWTEKVHKTETELAEVALGWLMESEHYKKYLASTKAKCEALALSLEKKIQRIHRQRRNSPLNK